jgi:hypothetical protein
MQQMGLIEAEANIAIYRFDSGLAFERSDQRSSFCRIRDQVADIRQSYGYYREDASSQGSSQASTSYAAPSSCPGTARSH